MIPRGDAEVRALSPIPCEPQVLRRDFPRKRRKTPDLLSAPACAGSGCAALAAADDGGKCRSYPLSKIAVSELFGSGFVSSKKFHRKGAKDAKKGSRGRFAVIGLSLGGQRTFCSLLSVLRAFAVKFILSIALRSRTVLHADEAQCTCQRFLILSTRTHSSTSGMELVRGDAEFAEKQKEEGDSHEATKARRHEAESGRETSRLSGSRANGTPQFSLRIFVVSCESSFSAISAPPRRFNCL